MDEVNQVIRKAAEFLERTAGVVDAQGRVVAATNPDLVGRPDEEALAVMSGEELTLVGDERCFQHIQLANQMEFVLYVQGSDAIAQSYLGLLANWIIAALADGSMEEERLALLKNILLENELPGDIPLKAREFKVPYAAPRQAYLILVEEGDSLECLETLQGLFPRRKQDFLIAIDEETIVLLKEIDREQRQDPDVLGTQILDTLNAESMAKVRIGIGMPAETLKDCAKSYREASLALTVGQIFESESYLMRYDKLGLGRLIYQLPPTLCHMFLDEVFPDNCYDSLDSETLLTIQKFFENNLNGSETSRQLFVHRNTLVYRLDKVQKITGLDLRIFDDAVLFKLAAMVRRYLEKQDRASLSSSRAAKWWRN
ncbi:MAG: helix-turn-helix domain-containing protein [Bacillota bacterium]|nr:helix-turn-helix domain-containing protein [Bacillota bacterium]